MKKYLLIIVMILLIGLNNFVFAENDCDVCGATHPFLDSYVNMLNEILSSMQTIGGNSSNLGQYGTDQGLFVGGVLTLSPDIADDLEKDIDEVKAQADRAIQTSLALTYIGFNNIIDVPRNNLMGLAILFNTYPIVRDWTKIQDLNSVIQDKVYELSLGGNFTKKLGEDHFNKINEILDNYKNDIIWDSSFISPDASYSDVLDTFQNINRTLERFLSFGGIDYINWFGNDNIYIEFEPDRLVELSEDYKCARFAKSCEGDMKKFIENIKFITHVNKEIAGESMKIFEDASVRLKTYLGALGNKKNNLTENEKDVLNREQDLLRTVYGSDYKKLNKGGIIGQVGSAVSSVAGVIKDLSKKSEDPVKKTIEDGKSSKQVREEIDNPLSQSVFGLDDIIRDSMINSMTASHDFSKKRMEKAVNVSFDNVLVYFPLILSQIQTISDLIGDKKSKGMIVENLGVACELQCQNKGGECRW